MKETIGVLNTSIITAEGAYTLANIPLNTAKTLANTCDLDSAIGHASTAQVMTTLLGVTVPLNRQIFKQESGQRCLIFKLNGRPAEGKILTAAEIETIGYTFQLLTRTK